MGVLARYGPSILAAGRSAPAASPAGIAAKVGIPLGAGIAAAENWWRDKSKEEREAIVNKIPDILGGLEMRDWRRKPKQEKPSTLPPIDGTYTVVDDGFGDHPGCEALFAAESQDCNRTYAAYGKMEGRVCDQTARSRNFHCRQKHGPSKWPELKGYEFWKKAYE